jgi:methyl-accepting chemotaxis protein
MASPFSDSESITSIESTDSVWSTTSSISNASSRTSVDSLDDNDDLIGTDVQANLEAQGELLGQIIENANTLLAKMDDIHEIMKENLATMERIHATIVEITDGLSTLSVCVERRRAMAEAAARRDARPGLLMSVVIGVKERLWGWME